MSKKDEYSFEKLQKLNNYKEWIRKMSFALRDAELMSYVNDTIRKLVLSKDDKDLEQIAKKEKVINTWVQKNDRVVEKLGKMCIKTVQMKFKDS